MRRVHPIAFSFALALTACGGSGDTSGSVSQNEISLRRTVWENRRAGLNYTIEYSVQCFCHSLPAKIRVTTNSLDQKNLVELIDDNGNVYQQLGPSQDLSQYYNVEEFFAHLAGPWADSHVLSVNFDSVYGYPTSIYLDSLVNLADDEFTYSISLIEIF